MLILNLSINTKMLNWFTVVTETQKVLSSQGPLWQNKLIASKIAFICFNLHCVSDVGKIYLFIYLSISWVSFLS